MFAADWNETVERLTGIFGEWLSQFSHSIDVVEESVKEPLESDFRGTIEAMDWEDENLALEDVVADVILSLEAVEIETYPELMYTQDIWQVFDEHTQECEAALSDFGGVQDCDSICDAVSTAVHAYLAEEASGLIAEMKDELEELKEMFCN